jgi:hypothetical protein
MAYPFFAGPSARSLPTGTLKAAAGAVQAAKAAFRSAEAFGLSLDRCASLRSATD